MRDYRVWHDEYDRPGSSLALRLQIVQSRLREVLSARPPGAIRLTSMCAGQGRDVLGVLPDHHRRPDVTATLVEIDQTNVEMARTAVAAAGLGSVRVMQADAAVSSIYADLVPADLLLACGIFGNVADADVENTVRHLSMLCSQGASVISTRHRREPDLTVRVRRWFRESGFEETSFDSPANETLSGVGVVRLIAEPLAFARDFRFFTFLR